MEKVFGVGVVPISCSCGAEFTIGVLDKHIQHKECGTFIHRKTSDKNPLKQVALTFSDSVPLGVDVVSYSAPIPHG
jgi:hypothetical protein